MSTSSPQRSSLRRRSSAIIVSLLCLLGLIVAVAPSASATSESSALPARCQDVTIPATIASGKVSLYGKFCLPRVGKPSTVQILVHGATYNHLYWDFPGFNGKYSYTRAANIAGYATLAIDRLGTGKSTRPASQHVTYTAQISTLHQVVQKLRSGLAGNKFKKVMMVGHSFGSAYTIGEAATYKDVDAVLLTGNGHQVSKLTQEQSVTFFHPANAEERFKDLDDGYVTTIPGLRDDGGFLYDMSRTDPAVVAVDEATKDVISKAEFATRPPNLGVLSRDIRVPVLIATGQQDTHYCGEGANDCTSSRTYYDAEAPFYNTCMSVMFLRAGHDINLHKTAPGSFAKMLAWSWATLSPHASKAKCRFTGGL